MVNYYTKKPTYSMLKKIMVEMGRFTLLVAMMGVQGFPRCMGIVRAQFSKCAAFRTFPFLTLFLQKTFVGGRSPGK
jgi:hypothetical protein